MAADPLTQAATLRRWRPKSRCDRAHPRPPRGSSERTGPGQRHARPDRRRPSIGRRTPAESARMPPRGAGTTASAAPPSRSEQDAAAPESGGAGPGLPAERERARRARILRMTAGSCRVAIRRSRPTFSYRWDLVESWLPDLVAEGRRLARAAALDRLEFVRSIHRSRHLSSRLKNRVPLYKGQTASRRSVENGKGSRPSLRCRILLNRGRGFSDHI